ncbi:carbohydrate ABC transporter permease [Streptacidiphilus sp. P02-A3a]|uniref:carbohydrate ABC transporter permease n=1 Tax=Streptacidiphilus sp. P02-A3a TaxID=2704468 RepID=UPI0015FB53CC|nr:carbohydrate ABC transporter permease [Streptacidiphilus sp. P02-A3a]QMU70647.1 carbohydrate ABC transporter permease [Streptacidiphilus sp. P02-A3a]
MTTAQLRATPGRASTTPAGGRPARRRGGWVPTVGLLVGAVYCLLPVLWVVIAATKSSAQLFSSFTMAPGTGLLGNLRQLNAYRGGEFWHWMLNSAFYAGVGALLSAALSGVTGYALAKYRFAGRDSVFNILLAGVLMPPVVLAIPQYLLMAKAGLADSYWSVLLCSIVSPYGIYLARIYAAGAIPDEVVEASRVDGASEWRLFRSVVVPMMAPGLVTVFLFQFVAIWNNFLLPYIMLGDDTKFPVTVGLFTLLNQGASQPALYTLVITGALISVLPLIILFLSLQRYWRLDLLSGAVKS